MERAAARLGRLPREIRPQRDLHAGRGVRGPRAGPGEPHPGDVVYFSFEQWQLATPSHGYSAGEQPHRAAQIVDLALFYERNNLLLNPDYGFVPANVFATIVRGLDELAAASQDLWKRGVEGETLSFRRREGGL